MCDYIITTWLNFGDGPDKDADIQERLRKFLWSRDGRNFQRILPITQEVVVNKFLWIFWGMGCLASNKPFDFGANMDRNPDTEIFKPIFSTAVEVQLFGNFLRGISCLGGCLLTPSDSSCSINVSINAVALHCARLVVRRVTAFGRVNCWEGKGRYGSFRLRMNVWVCR